MVDQRHVFYIYVGTQSTSVLHMYPLDAFHPTEILTKILLFIEFKMFYIGFSICNLFHINSRIKLINKKFKN